MNKLTVVGYLSGIPSKNSNQEKPLILDNFCKGVNALGDNGILHNGFNLINCDLAVIQGYVHEQGKSAPHLNLRKSILEKHKKENKHVLIADSNLFLYKNTKNPKHYLRYSFDGIFPTTGYYFTNNIDPDRWKKIQKDLNLQLKPWRRNGEHILICLQRNGGWSMQGLDTLTWLDNTISAIKNKTDRHIRIRLHPGDKKTKIVKSYKNVSTSSNINLTDDLDHAWATITYNSSPGVASAIEGVPLFVLDPKYANSQAAEVANTTIDNIENPTMPDRQRWLEKLSMSHWNFDELTSGEAWSVIKKEL